MNLVRLAAAGIGLGWLIVSPNEVWVFAAMLAIATHAPGNLPSV
jgi:hypothetical protein